MIEQWISGLLQFLSSLISEQTAGRWGLWQGLAAFGITYLGGFISSLTPCVYPMIPITIGVVGGMGPERRSWHQIGLRGLSYVAGMSLVYSFLGVIAGLSGRVFGSMTNQSGWYLVLGIIMTLSSLIMLEIIPFDPAMWWQTLNFRLRRRRKHSAHPHARVPSPQTREEMSFMGAFLLGVTSGFIAAPCTTPVLTTVLAFIAQSQSVALGFLLMLAFSLGLGTLLVMVAFFAGAIQLLPRSGRWLRIVKVLSGLILLAFGEYLIYRAGKIGGL